MQNGKVPVVQYLVDNGNVDVYEVDGEGRNYLHLAAHYGNEDVVRYFVETKGMRVNCRNIENGNTALHEAAKENHMSVARYLLERRGASINARNDLGCTPLFLATEKGRKMMVQFLIERGAKKECYNDDGQTPLQVALDNRNYDIANVLDTSRHYGD